MRKFISLLLTLLILSGCWNKQELNEIAISLALGIDKLEDSYRVTVQVVDPLQMSLKKNSERSPVIVVSEQADTIFSALRKMTQQTARRIYLSHIHLIVIDEETAKEGIHTILDLLIRDHEVRPDFQIVIAQDYSALDVLSLITPLEVLPALDIYHSIQNSSKNTLNTVNYPIKDVMKSLVKDGTSTVMTAISIKGDHVQGKTLDNTSSPVASTFFKIEKLAVFKKGKLVQMLSEENSQTYSFIKGEIENGILELNCPSTSDKFVLEIIDSNTKLDTSLRNNEQVNITIKVDIDAKLGEIHCPIDLKNTASITELNETTAKHLSEMIEKNVEDIQKNVQTDIFGFGELVHREYPTYWKEIKQDWEQYFETRLTTDTAVSVNIKGLGTLVNPSQDILESKIDGS
ncbi:Ger(x)C family spore germination protein [Alkalihalobacillus pseudalcaliphilus]|uniref:Ger(x)C family spore germination protein n=1 Tax=Alkalihalobacillus pseudalcaliphilus TaxID=79884 RepID=UPI00064DF5DA|nr:Ger(x)C family spore germination protein [Alkalihalobacillus pseudalcaliphilus]KMK76224.1 hypothetical protein AB990_13490 [Alkalihalobacillus pseudalcaliphilus]